MNRIITIAIVAAGIGLAPIAGALLGGAAHRLLIVPETETAELKPALARTATP